MKNLFSILAVFIFLSLANNSYCQEDRWIYIGSDIYNDFSIYYDKETIKYNGNDITVNLKFVFSNESQKYWDKKYIITKNIYYCGKEKIKIILTTICYRNGNIETNTIAEYQDIIPDTTGEVIYNYLCK